MTVRTRINAKILRRDLSKLEEGSPDNIIGDVLDAMFAAGRSALGGNGHTMPNDDGWAEAEAVIYDAIRRANPGKFEPPAPPFRYRAHETYPIDALHSSPRPTTSDMTAAQIFEIAPLGALISVTNGEPEPPERFRRKHSDWDRANRTGILVSVCPLRGRFTLNISPLDGDLSYRRPELHYSPLSEWTYKVVRPAVPGSILCAADEWNARWIQQITENEIEARAWLAVQSSGELIRVGDQGALTVFATKIREADTDS